MVNCDYVATYVTSSEIIITCLSCDACCTLLKPTFFLYCVMDKEIKVAIILLHLITQFNNQSNYIMAICGFPDRYMQHQPSNPMMCM